jgi:hypothetical protein
MHEAPMTMADYFKEVLSLLENADIPLELNIRLL